MNGMLNSLEGFDSGSNYKFGDKMIKGGNPRSLFDLTHLNTLTIQNAGMLIPLSFIPTLPDDDFDISIDAIIRVMPQVVPLYSRQRLYIYAFWSRFSDLCSDFQTFMTKGYSGNVEFSLPKLWAGQTRPNNYKHESETIEPDSLLDYFGLPVGASTEALFGDYDTEPIPQSFAGINVFKHMQFLRIYRDYFMNKNEWINDRVILPDDDSRFRVDKTGRLLSALDAGKEFYWQGSAAHHNITPTSGHYDLYIYSGDYYFSGAYHDYPDDYFRSALPFTQRGTAPQLQFSVDTSDFSISTKTEFQSPLDLFALYPEVAQSYVDLQGNSTLSSVTTGSPFMVQNDGQSAPNAAGILNSKARNKLNASVKSTSTLSGDAIQLGIMLEDLRQLAINQIELERMARTDGSYKQFGLTFFGQSSKASYDYRPLYIGGTYKNLAFTEVLQTTPTENTPLGNMAGHGITGMSNGNIGHLHSDDYGQICIMCCIMPDVYYFQGLDKMDTISMQSEMFLPDRAKLGMQPIYNKELYYAGNNGSSEGDDNYLWAYQNPFDEFRYMQNKIHGKIADSSNLSFFPYTQAQKFNSLPNWGRAFSEANNVRKDYLAAPSEDAYSGQFKFNIRAVRPLPYYSQPAQIIN